MVVHAPGLTPVADAARTRAVVAETQNQVILPMGRLEKQLVVAKARFSRFFFWGGARGGSKTPRHCLVSILTRGPTQREDGPRLQTLVMDPCFELESIFRNRGIHSIINSSVA